jgi:hypothetical protein
MTILVTEVHRSDLQNLAINLHSLLTCDKHLFATGETHGKLGCRLYSNVIAPCIDKGMCLRQSQRSAS